MGYSSGGDPVQDFEFGDVLDVLGGRSPWQSYIAPNLQIAKSSPKSFTVLDTDAFKQKTGYGTSVPGVTYKKTGDIIMQQWGAAGRTYLGAALHECVHLVSDPARQGTPDSTALLPLGMGLLEGLVEAITEDILTAQGMSLASDRMRGHQKRAPIVRELLKTTSIPFFARVLFQGDSAQFNMVMEYIYSKAEWNRIRAFATAERTQDALQLMQKARAAQEADQNRKAAAAGAELHRRFAKP